MLAFELHRYPSRLPADSSSGAETRITTDGRPITEGTSFAPPLVSIVTITFNSAAHLERAVESVFAQTYPNIEYILIDGGSTDGTVEIIEHYADRLSYWHSKPDGGISDAFNMGVAVSRGAYVGLVNSDDWMEPDQIEMAARVLSETGAPFVFGDLLYHNPDGSPAYKIHGDPDYSSRLWHRMPQVNHPTALVRRTVYERHGGFDPAWKIGMDYDWLCRLKDERVIGAHSADIVGHMSLAGISDRAWPATLDEHAEIAIQHGSPRYWIQLLFLLRKIRISLRIAISKVMGEKVTGHLRRLLNRSYAPAERNSPQ